MEITSTITNTAAQTDAITKRFMLYTSYNMPAIKNAKRIFTNSEGWKIRPNNFIESLAPLVIAPNAKTAISAPAPAIPVTYQNFLMSFNLWTIIGMKTEITSETAIIANCLKAFCEDIRYCTTKPTDIMKRVCTRISLFSSG